MHDFAINLKAFYNCIQAHKTNLAIEVLSRFPIVQGIEDLLQDVCFFFCRSPKKHAAFMKLAEFMECKGNKILKYNTSSSLHILHD
jgi:hypothetical protein